MQGTADGPKLTRNQSRVLGALSQNSSPSSAYDLLDQLRDEGLRNPLQIYRALNALIEHGLVHRLESLNAFVVCAHPHGHEHGLIVFAICTVCGRVEEFSDPLITERLSEWSAAHAFKPAHTIIEMRGTCSACRAGQTSKG